METIDSLKTKKTQLEDRLEKINADLSGLKSADFSEQATERENDEVLEEIAAKTAEEIKQLEKAIHRHEQDIWNVCDSCGGEISEERLNAVPTATLCCECME